MSAPQIDSTLALIRVWSYATDPMRRRLAERAAAAYLSWQDDPDGFSWGSLVDDLRDKLADLVNHKDSRCLYVDKDIMDVYADHWEEMCRWAVEHGYPIP